MWSDLYLPELFLLPPAALAVTGVIVQWRGGKLAVGACVLGLFVAGLEGAVAGFLVAFARNASGISG